MKVYTKTGDKGGTSLVGGSRVSKNSLRVRSYGEVDELVAHLGLLRALMYRSDWAKRLKLIQQDLMAACSYLAADPEGMRKLPPLNENLVAELEAEIDKMQDALPTQRHFIVPGASEPSAQAHIARCVCRRAERSVVGLRESGEEVPDVILQILNRLSDFLFVFSRMLSKCEGVDESYWIPEPKDVEKQ